MNGLSKRYGFDEESIHNKLKEFGFNPFKYNPFSRKLLKMQAFGEHNTIYVRDEEFVKDRLQKANPFQILNFTI